MRYKTSQGQHDASERELEAFLVEAALCGSRFICRLPVFAWRAVYATWLGTERSDRALLAARILTVLVAHPAGRAQVATVGYAASEAVRDVRRCCFEYPSADVSRVELEGLAPVSQIHFGSFLTTALFVAAQALTRIHGVECIPVGARLAI